MPTNEEKQHAFELMEAAITALGGNDFDTAERNAMAFLNASFDSHKIRRVLGMVHEKKGEFAESVKHLELALKYKPGDEGTWFHLYWATFLLREFENIKLFYANYPKQLPLLYCKKVNFYKLFRFFTAVKGKFGVAGAVEWVMAALDAPESRARVSDAIHGRDASPRRHCVDLVTDSRLTGALEALDTGDSATSVRLVAAFLGDASADLGQLEQLVISGPDAGHPVWHVINPHFHLWATAACEAHKSQSRWRESPLFAQGKPWSEIEPSYRRWVAGPEAALARREVTTIATELRAAPRVLDLGCGTGMLLRFFAEHCGVPVENLSGVELHEGRAACAREALSCLPAALADQDLAAAVAGNVTAGDLLNLDIAELKAKHGAMDLATLFVVSGCFDDDQFTTLLGSISELAPRYLMTTTVEKRWELWNGRDDEDAYYARAGYELLRRNWDPERLADTDIWQTIAPRKYWPNRSLSIYRRDDHRLAGVAVASG